MNAEEEEEEEEEDAISHSFLYNGDDDSREVSVSLLSKRHEGGTRNEDDDANGKGRDHQRHHASDASKLMGVTSTVLCLFFTVSGGPIGSEEIIAYGGVPLGITSMLVFPILYCVPVALVSGELSAAFPEDSSFTAWATILFGPFWSFQGGYWNWISGVIDSSMYPALMTEFIFGGSFQRYSLSHSLVSSTLALVCSVPNFLGFQAVDSAMKALGVLVMLPYLIMAILWFCQTFASHSNLPSNVTNTKHDSHFPWEPDYLKLFHAVFWSYSGWDAVGNFAGEIRNPNRTLPLALGFSVLLICFIYVVMMTIGLLTSGAPPWYDWTEGTFHDVASALGGKSLRDLTMFSSFISLIGMFVVEQFVDSCNLYGMSIQGLVHRAFSMRSARFDAPYVSLGVSVVIIIVSCNFLSFTMLMEVNNCISSLSVMFELVATVVLRFRKPQTPTKDVYRAPVSNTGLILLTIPAFLILAGIVITSVVFASIYVKAAVVGQILVGFALFFLCKSKPNQQGIVL